MKTARALKLPKLAPREAMSDKDDTKLNSIHEKPVRMDREHEKEQQSSESRGGGGRDIETAIWQRDEPSDDQKRSPVGHTFNQVKTKALIGEFRH